MRDNAMQNPTSESPKKVYRAPVLVIHGTVKDLTQTLGPHGTSDNGIRFGRNKTSP
ncbi:MAG: lasso RiPP family leader peptide-containing protein [Candidatus Acidiferrales bacterium]